METLSDKEFEPHPDLEGAYWESDVKKFIKDLKEELRKPMDGSIPLSWVNEVIDKLAGDKLI